MSCAAASDAAAKESGHARAARRTVARPTGQDSTRRLRRNARTATPGAVERRIGRWLGRYPGRRTPCFRSRWNSDAQGRASGLKINERADANDWAELAHGAYLLRTNSREKDPAKLWRWYIQLSQAEEAFRISKSDLSLRPVFHQKTERV